MQVLGSWGITSIWGHLKILSKESEFNFINWDSRQVPIWELFRSGLGHCVVCLKATSMLQSEARLQNLQSPLGCPLNSLPEVPATRRAWAYVVCTTQPTQHHGSQFTARPMGTMASANAWAAVTWTPLWLQCRDTRWCELWPPFCDSLRSQKQTLLVSPLQPHRCLAGVLRLTEISPLLNWVY